MSNKFDDINLGEENNLETILNIEGENVSTKNLQIRLIIEGSDGFNYDFHGKITGETSEGKKVNFKLPILSSVFTTGDYKSRIEVIHEGIYFFATAESYISAYMPTSIKASSLRNTGENKRLKPSNIKTIKASEAEAEVEDDTEVKVEDDTNKEIQKSIELWDHEIKASGGVGFEVKNLKMTMALSDSDDGSFEGYGSVFNNVDRALDIIKNGAFKRTLNNNKNIKMLWQHDPAQPIGVYTEAYEDQNGLFLKGQINLETQKGREAYSLLKQGAVDGLSIGYQVTKASKRNRSGVRELLELRVHEVSIVTFPCNELATVTGVKSIEDKVETKELNSQLKELLDSFK